ncbi:MAG: PQQ-dependent sugar dehydrogenase [Thermoanaerobaculia bacterium]
MNLRKLQVATAVLLLAIASVLLFRNGRRLGRALAEERVSAVVPADVQGGPDDVTSPVRLEPVATGFHHPLFVTHAGDGSGRIFVVEQGGKVLVVANGQIRSTPFLDLSAKLDSNSGERGLLGLAFAPDYAQSRRLFVAYTTKVASGAAVRISRFAASGVVGGADETADPTSESFVLEMADPASNHNGGMLAFGPDGMLWTGTGDGGNAGDPWDNARNPASLLGKILRLDVSTSPYSLPQDRPRWADSANGKETARGEIWALGLRNPWRFSFDRATGEIWIGDVGQNAWEEIDVASSHQETALHFGWKTMEGDHCYAPGFGCDTSGLVRPVHEYDHASGCSVTGGYVYRGRIVPALSGRYLFADYCSGVIWALERDVEGRAEVETLLRTGFPVSSFGEDEAGEVYVCDYSAGRILRLAPRN